ncbi:hypothetical protein [Fulvivirga sedimenti]|uniref:DNA polymerase III subunit gamma/tau n=1 Tax=Fulvivirga sedimenti TaxID=2879465 RepID=A0A9X1HL42_9BACT|nr:hypothetical protein [Fulvivirga sedimenti]MCA6073995.1 hypothetical protein [Fulvivirga sedimenti]
MAEAGRKKEEKKTEEQSQELYGEDPFDADQLRASWNLFAEQKKQEGRDVEYAILTQDFYLKEKYTIVLQLTNTVKINILDRFRSDLITYLKTELNNRHIQIETELLEEEKAYRPYTNKEKFEYLATKKPILKDLQERLGLDPDL